MCRTCLEEAISKLRISLGLENSSSCFSGSESITLHGGDYPCGERTQATTNLSALLAPCCFALCRQRCCVEINVANNRNEPPSPDPSGWPPYTLWKTYRRRDLSSYGSSALSPRDLKKECGQSGDNHAATVVQVVSAGQSSRQMAAEVGVAGDVCRRLSRAVASDRGYTRGCCACGAWC